MQPPDYWISVTRRQEATEWDQHTRRTFPPTNPQDGAQEEEEKKKKTWDAFLEDFAFSLYPTSKPPELITGHKKSTPSSQTRAPGPPPSS